MGEQAFLDDGAIKIAAGHTDAPRQDDRMVVFKQGEVQMQKWDELSQFGEMRGMMGGGMMGGGWGWGMGYGWGMGIIIVIIVVLGVVYLMKKK